MSALDAGPKWVMSALKVFAGPGRSELPERVSQSQHQWQTPPRFRCQSGPSIRHVLEGPTSWRRMVSYCLRSYDRTSSCIAGSSRSRIYQASASKAFARCSAQQVLGGRERHVRRQPSHSIHVPIMPRAQRSGRIPQTLSLLQHASSFRRPQKYYEALQPINACSR